MKMPPPIATKFTKLVLTILAITILGIILSFVSQDHTLLMPVSYTHLTLPTIA